MTSVARLSDFLPAVAVALGTPLPRRPDLVLPEADAYVVALVDGMGAVLLEEHAECVPFLSSLSGVPARSEIPSTTATSLTSLGTGLTPAEHGMVGYTSRIPGTRRLLNALEWDKTIDPEQWQPIETVFEQLARHGASVTTIGPRAYKRSGLTGASQRGAAYGGADRFGERLAAAVQAASQPKSLAYVYDGDLDAIGHRYGVNSLQWRAQLRLIDSSLEQLHAALPAGARLLITADHGMVDVPQHRRLDLDEVAALREGILLIGGEARFRHLYCAPDRADEVAQRWRMAIAEADATVMSFDEAQAAGWFGAADDRVRPRIGDVLVASLGDFAVMSSRDHPKEFRLAGMHGSITERETAIPLLIS